VVEKYGRIAFVPEALPLAHRPIPGELISSWLLRVSFANGLTLAQLIEAIETRFPIARARTVWIRSEWAMVAEGIYAISAELNGVESLPFPAKCDVASRFRVGSVH
jgi:hypothetical protein